MLASVMIASGDFWRASSCTLAASWIAAYSFWKWSSPHLAVPFLFTGLMCAAAQPPAPYAPVAALCKPEARFHRRASSFRNI
jgi:hypothetical protein